MSRLYSKFAENLLKGNINDLSSSGTTIKCALLANTYTPNYNTHDNWSDVSANEVSGTGYTAGGKALTNKSVTLSGSEATFDADDVSWSNSTIKARYAVLYDDTPASDTDKKLIALFDFGEDKESSNGLFTIQWNASGIFSLDMNPA